MLQSCVHRLRRGWPDARIEALTAAPDLLARHCPGVVPVAAEGRYEWVARGRARLPPRWRRSSEFLYAFRRADILLFTGRGGLTDAFADEAASVLLELEAAARIGLPVAMLGQGFGPLSDPALLARARAVLPGVILFGVREPRAAPAFLAQAGVAPARVVVTGDDAIEIALRSTPSDQGRHLGVGLRAAPYSGVEVERVAALVPLLRDLAEARGAELLPVPISRHPIEDDTEAMTRLSLPDPEPGVDLTVPAAVERAGRCRVVVAGSYHAAVFALAQGVPAVGLAGTPYYRDKFLGLEAQFGRWCRVVGADRPEEAVATAAELWDQAPGARDELLEAARRQAAQADLAYARLFELAAGPRAAPGTGPGPAL
jgi:polysaccharide pyruvyl transferase WcaK-like protein